MSEPIGIHPFEHKGDQYEARVFGDPQGYQFRVYQDDTLINHPARLITYEELPSHVLDFHGSDTKTLIEDFIDQFKKHN